MGARGGSGPGFTPPRVPAPTPRSPAAEPVRMLRRPPPRAAPHLFQYPYQSSAEDRTRSQPSEDATRKRVQPPYPRTSCSAPPSRPVLRPVQAPPRPLLSPPPLKVPPLTAPSFNPTSPAFHRPSSSPFPPRKPRICATHPKPRPASSQPRPSLTSIWPHLFPGPDFLAPPLPPSRSTRRAFLLVGARKPQAGRERRSSSPRAARWAGLGSPARRCVVVAQLSGLSAGPCCSSHRALQRTAPPRAQGPAP